MFVLKVHAKTQSYLRKGRKEDKVRGMKINHYQRKIRLHKFVYRYFRRVARRIFRHDFLRIQQEKICTKQISQLAISQSEISQSAISQSNKKRKQT